IWHYSHSNWNPDKKHLYSLHLQATDTNALSINVIRADYIINFANSLVGHQFKIIIQTTIFHVYDLVDQVHFKAWKAISILAALLWHTEIDNLEQYCSDVNIAAQCVLDAFALIDPTKIICKVELHLLSHLVRRFGPLTGVATD
ncbi:hypothetical protein K435DRAFT_584295, partial [Dendrothele bispora CBS 962.96]